MTAKQVGQRREQGAKLSLLLPAAQGKAALHVWLLFPLQGLLSPRELHGLAPGEGTVMAKCLFLGSTFPGPQCTAACGSFKGFWRFNPLCKIFLLSSWHTPPKYYNSTAISRKPNFLQWGWSHWAASHALPNKLLWQEKLQTMLVPLSQSLGRNLSPSTASRNKSAQLTGSKNWVLK